MKDIIKGMVLLLVCFFMVGCSNIKEPEYYHKSSLIPYQYDEETFEEDRVRENEREATKEQKQILEKVFKKLKSVYKFKGEMPEIRQIDNLDENPNDSYKIYAEYGRNDVIYISSDFSEKNVPVMAHELIHYFGDKGKKFNGLQYLTKDKEFILGSSLTEGVTNYLSTRVFPFTKEESVYEYETHAAELLALLVGEKTLEKAFFNSDLESIKRIFEDTLDGIYKGEKSVWIYEDTPKEDFSVFDVFTASLDSHSRYLGDIEVTKGATAASAIDMADSAEEMLIKALEKKGKKKEAKNIVEKLLANEYMIPWTQISNIPWMIE